MSLCAMNVTAASTSKLTTATHNGYATDVRSQQQTVVEIMLLNNNGDKINTTTVNQSVILGGVLTSVPSNSSNYLGGATVNIQGSLDGNKWIAITHVATQTGEFNGFFAVKWTQSKPGVIYFRATYDGDNQYAPTVSNVVKLTVN